MGMLWEYFRDTLGDTLDDTFGILWEYLRGTLGDTFQSNI